MTTRKTKETKVEPIPAEDKKGWEALLKETRAVVARQDHTRWELILLAGKVETVYGQNKLGRWSDEAHIGFPQAKQYSWMARTGVDEAFVNKWCKPKVASKKLSFSVVREVATFCGGLQSKYAIEYLQWAVDHKATIVAIQGYMLQTTAPHQHKDEAYAAIKMALRDKQEHEGFTDYVRTILEGIAESRPDFHNEILSTVITNEKDLTALKVAAGVIGEEERKLVEECKKALDRLKKFRRYINQNADTLKEGISYNHEISQELKHMVQMLGENLTEIGKTPLTEYPAIDPSKVIEVEEKVKPAPRSRKKKELTA